MKKRSIITRAIALLLCLMLMSTAAGVLASAAEVTYNQNCPMIFIHGFMGCNLYADVNDHSAGNIYPPSMDTITGAVVSALPAIGEFALDKDWEKFGDAVLPPVQNILLPMGLDKNGEVRDNSGPGFVYPSPSSIRSNSSLSFDYDWRVDPIVSAEQLHEFIEYVCRCSGCEKVCLSAHSLGGVILVSYVALHGTGRLQGVVMNSTAVFGETYTGELMTGNISISLPGLIAFLRSVLSESEYDELVGGTLTVLAQAGVLDFVQNLADDAVDNIYYNKVVPELIFPFLCQMPTVWAMVPDEYMDAAMDYVFAEMVEDPAEYSGLIEKIENYNTLVRPYKAQVLNDINENCRLGVFARYGLSMVPVTSTWTVMSDTIVDTKYASFGATCADYGKTLTEEQRAMGDPKYISPDNVINASTCMFPDQTWFLKNYVHNHVPAVNELQYAICYAAEPVTIDSYEKYPQYMIFDSEEGTFSAQEGDTNKNILDRIIDFFKQLWNLIKKIFARIGA